MNIVIFGKKGCGKTSWVKKNLEEYDRIIIIDTLNEYGDVAILKKIEELPEFENRDKFKIRVVPLDILDFNLILLYIWQRFKNVLVIIDEFGYWVSSYSMPEPLKYLLRFGRHIKVNIWAVIRRPYEAGREITALADKFIIFKLTEPRDLDYFREYDKELPEKIENLQKFEYIEYIL